MDTPPLIFVLPGSIDRRSGGTLYDKRIVAGLRAMGLDVTVAELPGEFPLCDGVAASAADWVIDSAPDGACLVVDGLALPAFAKSLGTHSGRLRVTALVHHPLAAETGLAPDDRDTLYALERDMLRNVAGIVTTSPATAQMLVDDYGVAPARIATVLPGTAPAPAARGSGGSGPLRLLCVAALIARKNHVMLLDVLAETMLPEWRLDCVGGLDRDPAVTAAVQDAIARHDFYGRVVLHGEADEAALAVAYDNADVFVLPSALEGYGMAFAEALAHGLPVIGSGDGAVRETVPSDAGIIVPVGDRAALADALTRMLTDPACRARYAAGARSAGQALPDWNAAARRFAAAIAPVRAA
jgi:glycosyltransferase involved in cell wall biosynthesis